jgi:hypothetical protein
VRREDGDEDESEAADEQPIDLQSAQERLQWREIHTNQHPERA